MNLVTPNCVNTSEASEALTRNGTEPEVIVTLCRRGHRICYGKLVLLCHTYQCTESWSSVLYLPRRRDKHPADSIEPHQENETF